MSAAGTEPAIPQWSPDPCRPSKERSIFHTHAAARARINLTYLWRHGRLPNLTAPTRFTELIQLRKLYDRDPRLPLLADKVLVKAHVAQVLGPEWVIPSLWHGAQLPAIPPWTPPFVVKSRHGCNQHAFVRTGREDWAVIRRRTRRWMRSAYGLWLDEWLYRRIERGLLVEPFVGEGGALPVDYKLNVVLGRVAFIQVHLGREHAHRWIVFDAEWRRLSTPGPDDPPRPRSLPAMIAAAEELGRDFPFVRVDFYEIAGRPLFGEMTFYPGSGLDRFSPTTLDTLAAARSRPAGFESARSMPMVMHSSRERRLVGDL